MCVTDIAFIISRIVAIKCVSRTIGKRNIMAKVHGVHDGLQYVSDQ